MPQRFFSATGIAIWVAGISGAVCVLPYMLALAPGRLEEAVTATQLPLSGLLLISIIQSAVVLGLMTFSGLWAARRLGLGAPLL